MIKKAVLLSVFISLIQLFFSCDPCVCPDPQAYEIVYDEILVTAFNTAGFYVNPVEDTVYKNAFGITLITNYEMVLIAANISGGTGLGFSSLMACDCITDSHTYADPISHANIYATDALNQETMDVTDKFVAFDPYANQQISINELFEQLEPWQDLFQFELADFDSIPNSAIFTVKLYLESGIKFIEHTEQINFY